MVEKELSLALVTGAAHRLGRAFAVCLGRLGYAVLLHYNSSDHEAREAAEEIGSLGVPVYSFKADLANPAEIESLFSYVDSLPHTLQILVNSAAIMHRGDIRTLSTGEWDATMALNLRTPFLMAQGAAPRMKENGLIVNITDAGIARTWTGFPAYLVSKSGLAALTKVLAKALAPSLRVNAIAPGLVLPSEDLPDSEWQRLVERLPLKRQTREEDITAALEFLIKNTSITGQTIVVDGGYSLV